MKKKAPPEPLNRESLEKLPPAQLVEIVLRLQELILKQGETIERLKILVEKDSTTSSKPSSTDIIKKSEKPKEQEKKEGRRPGGQLGHQGKTRKGFGQIDRSEFLKAEKCQHCGSVHLEKGGRSLGC
jgi:transposase